MNSLEITGQIVCTFKITEHKLRFPGNVQSEDAFPKHIMQVVLLLLHVWEGDGQGDSREVWREEELCEINTGLYLEDKVFWLANSRWQ